MSVRYCFLSVLLFLSVFAGCQGCDAGVQGRCESDEQCGDFRICDTSSGQCFCADDRGCDTDEFCNAAGRCQVQAGCFSNDDCIQDGTGCENQFCDVTTNNCISVCECDPDEGEVCCTLDSQCSFGQVCSVLERKCVPGCQDDGDCRLGEGCVKEQIGGLGTCVEGFCTRNNLCGFGEICDLEQGECVFDTRGPYCYSCTGGVSSDDCGEPGNYCLTDSNDPTGQSSFCGIDCHANQPCPYGYECSEVIIIPQTLPFCSGPETCEIPDGAASGFCSRNSTSPCSEDEDCPEGPPGSDCPRYQWECEPETTCPGGSECPIGGICPAFGHCLIDQQPCETDENCCDDPNNCPAGSCVMQKCVGGEGSAFGHCTCTIDSDCPADGCSGANLTDPDNPIYGNCSLSGHPCLDDIDCDNIACVNGGCRIGANCAPANGRTCGELLGQ